MIQLFTKIVHLSVISQYNMLGRDKVLSDLFIDWEPAFPVCVTQPLDSFFHGNKLISNNLNDEISLKFFLIGYLIQKGIYKFITLRYTEHIAVSRLCIDNMKTCLFLIFCVGLTLAQDPPPPPPPNTLPPSPTKHPYTVS